MVQEYDWGPDLTAGEEYRAANFGVIERNSTSHSPDRRVEWPKIY